MGQRGKEYGPLPEFYYYDRSRVVPLVRSATEWSAFCLDRVDGICDAQWLVEVGSDYGVDGYVALPTELIPESYRETLVGAELLLPVFDHQHGTVVVLPVIQVYGSADQCGNVLSYLSQTCSRGFDHRVHGDDPSKPSSMDVHFYSQSGLEAYRFANEIVECLGVQAYPHFLQLVV